MFNLGGRRIANPEKNVVLTGTIPAHDPDVVVQDEVDNRVNPIVGRIVPQEC